MLLYDHTELSKESNLKIVKLCETFIKNTKSVNIIDVPMYVKTTEINLFTFPLMY